MALQSSNGGFSCIIKFNGVEETYRSVVMVASNCY
jgi:hypothetical protein